MRRLRRHRLRHAVSAGSVALLCAPLLLGLTAQPAAALSIIPNFDSTITSDPNAAAIEAAITLALSPYAMFSDPVTVNILYQASHAGTSSYLGESGSAFYQNSYAAYTGALATDAASYGNSVEQSGVTHLSSGNVAQSVLATAADLRALGCGGCAGTISSINLSNNTLVTGGSYDGAIAINLSQPLQFSRNANGTINGGFYDAISVIQHETDEVLGIGGSGSILNDVGSGSTPPSIGGQTTIGALDLFRYSAAGTPSLTTSGSASSYFSLDGGTTHIASFNQSSNGDFGDWLVGTGHVQDAFTPSGQVANVSATSPEGLALQAIGYDVPEPASLALLAVGAAFVTGLRRRPRRRIAA
ncbi:MAG TPA: NF038122 family metalloprotease [Acetobacteraceae bacterium]|nr:NF038122 family metalloprotease [Acetobacteraceae bacterium]